MYIFSKKHKTQNKPNKTNTNPPEFLPRDLEMHLRDVAFLLKWLQAAYVCGAGAQDQAKKQWSPPAELARKGWVEEVGLNLGPLSTDRASKAGLQAAVQTGDGEQEAEPKMGY